MSGVADKLAGLAARPAAANFGWLTLDRLNRLVVTLVLGVWTARVLAPEGYGRLNYALALTTVLAALPGLGLEQILRRELVRAPEREAKLLGTAFALRLALGLCCYGALALAAFSGLLAAVDTTVLLLVGATLLQPSTQTLDAWFQARLDARAVVLAQNTALLVASLVRAAVLLANPTLAAIVGAMLVEFPLGAVIVAVLYQRRGHGLGTFRFDPVVARSLVREGLPLLFSGLAIMIYHRIDQVMLPSLANASEAGQYAAAVRVVELWNFVPLALAVSWAPALVRAHAAGPGEFRATVARQFARHAGIAWVLAGSTALAAPWFVPLLFGHEYAAAGRLVAWLAPSLPFVALGVARSEAWVAAGLSRFSLPAALLGAGLNVALNLVLIPRWGAIGAAVATLVSYAAAAVGASFLYSATRELAWLQLNALALRGVLWDRRPPP